MIKKNNLDAQDTPDGYEVIPSSRGALAVKRSFADLMDHAEAIEQANLKLLLNYWWQVKLVLAGEPLEAKRNCGVSMY